MCGWTSNNEKYWFEASLSRYYSLSSGSTRRRELGVGLLFWSLQRHLVAAEDNWRLLPRRVIDLFLAGFNTLYIAYIIVCYSLLSQVFLIRRLGPHSMEAGGEGALLHRANLLRVLFVISFVSGFFLFVFWRWRPGTVLHTLANVGGFFFS